MEKIDYYLQKIYDMAIEYGPRVLLAIVTLIIGLWIIKTILRGVRKGFQKIKIDDTMQPPHHLLL